MKDILGYVKRFESFSPSLECVDLAVAVVIGAAFGAIVTSFVNDIITPLILNPTMKAAGVELLVSWNGVAYGGFLALSLSLLLVLFFLQQVKAAESKPC